MRNTVEGWQLNKYKGISSVRNTCDTHVLSYSCLWIWATCFWLSFLSPRVSFQVSVLWLIAPLFLWWQNLTNWAQSPPNTDLWVLKFMIKQFGCAFCSEEMEKLNFSSASVAVLAMISDQKVVQNYFGLLLATWNLNIGMIYGNKSSDSH